MAVDRRGQQGDGRVAASADDPRGVSGLAAALDALDAAFDDLAADGGTAALVVRDGEDVLLDRAAGHVDEGPDLPPRPFTTRTPVFLYSAVKPVTALTVLLAAADGALPPLDTPVAAVWPAFGAHGKHTVTLARALAHGAAVPGWRDPMDLAGLGDRVGAAAALARSVPWWPPGEPGEHALSYGHLLDAFLRHGTGADIEAWWTEVAAAGIPVTLRPPPDVAPLRDRDGAWRRHWLAAAEGPMGDLLRNPPELLDVSAVNGPIVRDLVAPAVTGYGSAHNLATLWNWWVGEAATERLGADLQERSLSPVVGGHDHVLGRQAAWGLGPQVDADEIGMGGVGGCFGGILRRSGLVVGFTTADVAPVGRVDVLDGAFDTLAAVER
jgi:hypothetical protein